MDTHSQHGPHEDPFRPPTLAVEVICLHCGSEYDSGRIEWRQLECGDHSHGCWCCPTPGCQGSGYGFDILPSDPSFYEGISGWFGSESEEPRDEQDGPEEMWVEQWCDEAWSLSEATAALTETASAPKWNTPEESAEGFPWQGAGRDAPPMPGPRLRLFHPPQE